MSTHACLFFYLAGGERHSQKTNSALSLSSPGRPCLVHENRPVSYVVVLGDVTLQPKGARDDKLEELFDVD